MARRKKLPAEPIEVQIRTLLENGRGSAIHGENQLQVFDALPGETVMARYLFGRRMRGQAQTVEVLTPSNDRIEPRCPHFGSCSACTLQHLGHPAQLAFKQDSMLQHLQSGGVQPQRVLAPLSAGQWNYRRKARLSVRYVRAKDRVLVGFRERDGRFVADMQECHVLTLQVAEQLPALCKLLASMEARETIPQIEVTSGDDGSVLIFRHLEPLSGSDVDKLRKFGEQSGLQICLQPKGPGTVHALGQELRPLKYALPEYSVDFEFAPLDFVQVNGELNRTMIAQALDLLAPGKDETVLDLFCGLGNFSLPLARHCAQVTGVEGDPGLVARANHNARRNQVGNAHFVQADLYTEAADLGVVPGHFDKILLDPPRSGAQQVLPAIAASATTRVVYVSCNPETLGRDAGLLVREHGFELKAAGIMDMFPQTSHIESMALFERQAPTA
jgi:23S rRNA (uracil1939-C5)-methyltransferase